MIARISKMIANYLFKSEIISEHETEIYIYGFETILSGIIDLFITLFLGLLSKSLINSIVFFLMFVSMRIYTGGYHANTYLKCKTLFIIINFIIIGCSKIQMPLHMILMILMLFLISVIFLAPVENKKKEITVSEKKKYRKISIVCSIFWSMTAIVTYFFNKNLSSTISITAFIITILIVVGEFRKEVNS